MILWTYQYTVAYPDSALYTECCIALAEYEDSQVGVAEDKEGNSFSTAMPDVLKYRKGTIEVAFEYSNNYLMGHYYPYVVNTWSNADELSDFKKAVAKQQSEIVFETYKISFLCCC